MPDEGGEFIVTEGGLANQRGLFTRDQSGAVTAADFAGRTFPRE